MLHRDKSKDSSSTRKVTPPSPSYMNNEQFAAYLAGLRENRVNRPGGARPPPPSTRSRPDSMSGRPSIGGDSIRSEASTAAHQRTGSDFTKPRGSRPSIAGSVSSRYSMSSTSGRDYFPEKSSAGSVAPLRPGDVVPSATYIERGQRWMEKEEAFSIHQAMNDMNIKDEAQQPGDDDTRVYNAALDEAAELVWQHQHGVKPRAPDAPYRYKSHLRKNSYAHARTASAGRYGNDIGATGLARDSGRSFSGSSSGSDRDNTSPCESIDLPSASFTGSARSRTNARVSSGGRRRSSMKRNISGEVERPFSGDQIWEEPESNTSDASSRQPQVPDYDRPLGAKTRNSPTKVQFAPNDPIIDSAVTTTKPLSRTEIHRNPPTQSRDPSYTTNPDTPPIVSQDIHTKNGIELRSDDIRQATSMRLKDRSPKLPTPSAVSDAPGRPIVSFDKNWKAPEEAAAEADTKPDQESRRISPFGRFVAKGQHQGPQGPQPPIPTISFTPDIPNTPSPSASQRQQQQPSRGGPSPIPSIQIETDDRPEIPSIAVSDDTGGPPIPTIVLPGDETETGTTINNPSIPMIITPDDNPMTTTKPSSARPLPTPASTPSHLRNARGGGRPLPQGHWSPAAGASPRATAACHECGHPIVGRFVALKGASERFHPQCFRCYSCGTGLEALEISPEPDNFRSARLERIARRAAGEILDENPGETMAEDGDSRLRFYCHLDWHELFAPRCKHCKTPILGEHIVALGGQHFHHGHFFCAECGDPFGPGNTHIEKDGYAWCVNCQTKRTERRAPKCKRCKKPTVGQYVIALGGEWHDECFRCADCGGGFDDGQVFPVERSDGATVLCTGCRARELKA
ncbi:hypothetical protein F5Y16DRAFT_378362 [Xylariaceae sp. FL0255]|nr:hypothetical protein F5Y16DRAFT_378362 [Xylariaceae sp. FL0255]